MPGSTPLRISVVIPNYQRAGLLMRAVRSALDQTTAPLEILVCDDGSTDDSRARVDALDDARVRFIALRHSGLPAVARNVGIRQARGDWVAFLDSDDVWHADKLERQAEALALGHGAVGCNARLMDADGRYEGLAHPNLPRACGLKELATVDWVVTSSVVARRDLLVSVGGFPETTALRTQQDHALWLRLASRAPWYFCPEALVDYRHATTESHSRHAIGHEWRQHWRVVADFLGWSLLSERRGGAAWEAFAGFGRAVWARRHRFPHAVALRLKALGRPSK